MKLRLVFAGFLVMVCVMPSALASEADDIAVVKKVLRAIMPDSPPDSLSAAAIPGMYEAVYGLQILYVSADGRFLLQGDLYDLKLQKNLTEIKRQDGRVKIIDAIDPKSMIVFAADEPKYTITAFTDIDCGYCRKLHRQIADYNKLGISVRYLAYPRSGVNTESYYKAVSVWCAKDRKAAMTQAKSGESLEKRECDNPVKAHMAAAHEVGVSGTPTLVLDNGRVIPGYVDPARLVQILEQEQKKG